MHSMSMMAVYYMHWGLVFLICLTKVEGQKIELTSHSLGYPDYYINDILTWNCTASGYTRIISLLFTVDGVRDVDCTIDSLGWSSKSHNTILNLPALDYCKVNGDRAGFTLLANHQITPDVKGLQIRCRRDVDIAPEFSNTLTISTSLKVAPQGLAFVRTNQDQPVVEGEAFEFQCTTTSASNSTYQYDLKRRGEVIRPGIGRTYIPDQDDRRGFSIRCVDIVHVNWRGGNTVTESNIITPLYGITIEGSEGIQRNALLNPLDPLPLTCDVIGNPPPAFSWERDLRPLAETSNTITLQSANDGDVETVTCAATVEGIPSITITWMVTWDDRAPTPPPTSTSTTPRTITTVKLVASLALIIVSMI